jgi:hypothetical protein
VKGMSEFLLLLTPPSSHHLLAILTMLWLLHSSDLISPTYFIYLIHYPSSRRLSSLSSHSSSSGSSSSRMSRSLSFSDPGISVSISPNETLSSRAIREYVSGLSDQRLYLLKSGLIG